jgi:hypothetical protein
MKEQIFLNYRRQDSEGSTGRLYDQLIEHFDPSQIFMDVDTIEPGLDFVEVIDKAVGSCNVLLAIIGNKWLTITDETGKRRLDNPNDFVRIEIASALARDIRVIPVLVQGASMPAAEDLPDDLKPLTRRNAIELSHARFKSDVERLVHVLQNALRGAETGPTAGRKAEAKAEMPEEKKRAGFKLLPLFILLVPFVLYAWWTVLLLGSSGVDVLAGSLNLVNVLVLAITMVRAVTGKTAVGQAFKIPIFLQLGIMLVTLVIGGGDTEMVIFINLVIALVFGILFLLTRKMTAKR